MKCKFFRLIYPKNVEDAKSAVTPWRSMCPVRLYWTARETS